MHLPGLPGARRALGAGPGLRGLAGTCEIPPRLPSFEGQESSAAGGRVLGIRVGTLGLELAEEPFPGRALGSAGRALS